MRIISIRLKTVFMRVYILCFGAVLLWLNIAQASLPEDTEIRLVTGGLNHPWGMSWVDERHLLVTERRGRMFLIATDTGQKQDISAVPEVFHKGQGGLLDVVYDRQHQLVYLCFSRPAGRGKAATAVMQARLDGLVLREQNLLFTSNLQNNSGYHFGCRLVIHQNRLYASLGERGKRDTAQDPALQSGGVIGYDLEQMQLLAPARPEWAAGMQSKGNRNPQGMTLYPHSGEVWMHEHGPKGGDEINILIPGANYGWPVTSYGREYYGARIGKGLTEAEGITPPLWHWTPSIAPSGMAFYTGDMFDFKGDLLVGSLKFRSLYRIEIHNKKPTAQHLLMKGAIGRVRDIEISPDGSVYLLSDEADGGLYQLHRPGN